MPAPRFVHDSAANKRRAAPSCGIFGRQHLIRLVDEFGNGKLCFAAGLQPAWERNSIKMSPLR
jgi:hypothetical protein